MTAAVKKPTQCLTILNHLRRHGSITQVEAMAVHKIPRLAARIGELRNGGWYIRSVLKADDKGARYVRYELQVA